jgi:Transcriptional regulation of mitochondrial recombination
LKQLPFNGKKTKPPKVRRDLWRPMAVIQFPEGHGKIGESVYQKLREFKKMHELSWGDEVLFNDDGTSRTKKERGIALNDQKLNAIADLAAVLAGTGKGNLIRVDREQEKGVEGVAAQTAESQEATAQQKATELTNPRATADAKDLLGIVVYWENDLLRHHAESWSANVTHSLFEDQLRAELAE